MPGYGRGYYGDQQLAPQPKRSKRGWIMAAAAVGVGAGVWWWWRKRSRAPQYEVMIGQDFVPQAPTAYASPTQAPPAYAPAVPMTVIPTTEIDQLARERGFPSVQAFEDAVVANAKQLQAAGAKVTLAPPLQHLASRLEA